MECAKACPLARHLMRFAVGAALVCLALIAISARIEPAHAQSAAISQATVVPGQPAAHSLPPRIDAARRFLAQRGWNPAATGSAIRLVPRQPASQLSVPNALTTAAISTDVPTWQSLGPGNVQSAEFGAVTGRIAALALDSSDSTGNRLYVGTTGGGVWVAQNAGTSTTPSIAFTPLTDSVDALRVATDASISIGALTVQPGGSGVILAGTGDPNDVLDSYYGAGILRSTDNGDSWSLISRTSDVADGLGVHDVRFYGEGIAGFAWSTANTQLVVAAVAQAYEGATVNAVQLNISYQGLYYSTDAGATWHMATITDGGSNYVQGPLAAFAVPDGNAATSVVWNPIRKIFIAAVRFHGYYQSPDGKTFTRMATQPGAALMTAGLCPNNPGHTGSVACPIYRGTLAVNPSTGDTFTWTVDRFDQDQGLWQDQCVIKGDACTISAVTFSKNWSTTALDTNTSLGASTIADGSYTLALAAVPAGLGAGQDTLLFAGDDDLWKCSLAEGCVWGNTTNAFTCKSAAVGPYQHAITWNTSNPAEIFIGNDSGLWRSTDTVGESGTACSASDSQHFQNLNGNLGSLAEVTSFSAAPSLSSGILAGLGVNGVAGAKSTPDSSAWPQVLSGYGGPVVIDSADPNKWYVNNQLGVAIYRCSNTTSCAAADFGSSPVIDNADVGKDGQTMPTPAPFMVDPLDTSQLLIGTCRVWRGAADGSGWTSTNAISPILDSKTSAGPCSGNALIRSMAARALGNGTERVYIGMFGAATYGANLAGHILSATVNPASSTAPVWSDLTLNPVSNSSTAFNAAGMDISSIYIDPHDATGNTVYVTVEGITTAAAPVQTVYRSTDGGAHWASVVSNLPNTAVSGLVVDPQDVDTVYIATDVGVYFTSQVSTCAQPLSTCWAIYGAGLPLAPVVSLGIANVDSSPVLLAATYGRGIWQAKPAGTGTSLASASVNPTSLTFAGQAVGSTSSTQAITLQNSGSTSLTATNIQVSGDFIEADNCLDTPVASGASCAIQVKFAPNTTGSRTGQIVISANISGGQIGVDLSGTGLAAGAVTLLPTSVDLGDVGVGSSSDLFPAQLSNSGTSGITISSVTVTAPFVLASNSCGSSLAANSSCQLQLKFEPTQAGVATGTLTLVDSAGTRTVALSGTGQVAATDVLNIASLSFPATPTGASSDAQTITLTNSGDLALTAIAISASGPFRTSGTCGSQLAGHASCTISVVFAPTQQGSLTGTLTVSDLIRIQTVALAGTAVAPAVLSVVPMSLTFSAQQAGIPSAPQTLAVSNLGGASMANIGFQFTGSAAANYSIYSTNCGAALSAGSSCTAKVVFTPSATGDISAALIVSSSTLGVAAVPIPINGSGQVGAGIAVTPQQMNFAAIGVGQSSAARTATITNGSGYAIRSLTLDADRPFAVTQNTCTGSLAAGASCTAAVEFLPTASGAASGVLAISSPDLSSTASVSLSGVGFDFDVAFSGTSTYTVASGQTANYTVTVNPAAGSSGTFTFACGSLPSNTACSFNPTSMTVNSGITGSVMVSIATGKTTTASAHGAPGWASVPLVCGVLLLPLALVRRRRILLQLVLLVLAAGAISSCSGSGGGGGSGGSSSGSSTPAGTYKIPVTVTSTGVSHTATLTLIVD